MNLCLECIALQSTSLLENSFSLNHLTVIKIWRCEKLENVFSTSILRCLPQLVALKIEECKELKHIIEDDLENDESINFKSTNTYFPKLEILIVGNCNRLKCVFPTSICKELPKLKVLMIREVYELQDIFKTEGDDQKLEIPNLEVIAFIDLPNLSDAQKVLFEAVNYRFLHSCHNFSLTSASKSDDIDDINDIIRYFQGIGTHYINISQDIINLCVFTHAQNATKLRIYYF